MPLPAVVVFDLDGTLVDTAVDLAHAVNHCLALADRPALSTQTVRNLIGNGARALIQRGLEATGTAPEAQINRLMPDFLNYYRSHLADFSHSYPYVRETLEALLRQGCCLGVCTNKPETLARDLLDQLGLTHFFGAILGGDSLPVRKPDPAPLLETIRRLEGTPAQAVMVGDTAVDIATARSARIPVVAVTFGFGGPALTDHAPSIPIDHYSQMLWALAQADSMRDV
jgi:phosphoglycolate phosphatase